MDAPVLYLVRCWINPHGGQKVIEWLDNGHLEEVVAQPGFLWARRAKLDMTDEEGWPAYQMVYGIESEAALEAYKDNPIREKFMQEGKAFEGLMKIERAVGVVEYAHDKPAAKAAE